MVEGLWDYTEEERAADDYEILRIIAGSIDQLRSSLIADAQQGPVEYCYTPIN
jgi:hypothetical protein